MQLNVTANENLPKQNKRQLVAHGQNFSINNCRTKLPAMIPGRFRVITELLFLFFRLFLEETPKDIWRNIGLETTAYIND